ncbi:MAG TPA: extradiol ring-cleavage dioxygenase [Chloroflexota bacterium]
MSKIVAGLASSHAYAFLAPEQWDERRKFTRANYARRYGSEPPDRPEIDEETLEDNQARFQAIRGGFATLRSEFDRLQPDAWILIGDDQDENYRENNLPQFAIYTGDEFVTGGRGEQIGQHYTCDAELSRALLEGCVENGFDLASSKTFPNGLISHAHRDVMRFLDPQGKVPMVPIFVNAIHVPAPSPRRCFEFGQILRETIEAQPDNKRVAVYASGGWSHFTAGYPYEHLEGPHPVGYIAADFDQKLATLVSAGRLSEVTQLSSSDLLNNGDIEFRQWIVMLGMLGDAPPDQFAYQPFFRGVMGMAVGYWNLENSTKAVATSGR